MEDDVVFDGGYQVPGSVYSRLFDYQKTGTLLHIDREQAVNSWWGHCMHSGYSMCHQSAQITHSMCTAVTAALQTQEANEFSVDALIVSLSSMQSPCCLGGTLQTNGIQLLSPHGLTHALACQEALGGLCSNRQLASRKKSLRLSAIITGAS